MILFSIDKLMVVKFLTPTDVGSYSLGVLVLELVLFIPTAIVYVLLPYQIEEFAKNGKKKIKQYLLMPSFALAYTLPFILGLGAIFVGPTITFLLPEYIASIIPTTILLCACFFLGLIYINQNFLVSINQEKKILVSQITMIIFAVAVDYVLIKLGFGINGVAFGTMIVAFIGFIMTHIYSYKHYIEGIYPMSRSIAILLIPLALNLLFMVSSAGFVGVDTLQQFLYGIVKVSFLLLINIPFFFIVNKKTKAVAKSIKIMKDIKLFARFFG